MTSLSSKLLGVCQNSKAVVTLNYLHRKPTRELVLSHILFTSVRTRYAKVSVSQVTSRYSSSSKLWGHHPIFVRDACACSICVDPHSGQKNFKTTDIPQNIMAKSVKIVNENMEIEWSDDIPGIQSHKSTIPLEQLSSSPNSLRRLREGQKPITWNSGYLNRQMPKLRFDYNQYINDSEILHQVTSGIRAWGIVFLTSVPEAEDVIENIAGRIGSVRMTFYGKTWNVKSVHEAKNVAYTDRYLGLHQDLLYMENPPGIQILHCLKNSCKGGHSLFSDAFRAAAQLPAHDFDILSKGQIAYHYQKDGEHFLHSHPVLEVGSSDQTDTGGVRVPLAVNYSPPFQAPFFMAPRDVNKRKLVYSLGKFAQKSEEPQNVFKYKLRPGECVIFNNRRILHGREAFESQKGERWLKGCYLDTDVFTSRSRVVYDSVVNMGEGPNRIRRMSYGRSAPVL
ncbi:Gamma-butyrobetaine dioxygenase [Golovinomyces cichoracearum]|uniref:Gamma-butyrobetaine dioxygenase n=1 Tax=Golovinomyces cichoracearum TaxID=62708 RepID=A0A420I7M3_9PEZI|nr:Gamma-butyrobetaine dioxygenase [Golovinomyces cichoracearum]